MFCSNLVQAGRPSMVRALRCCSQFASHKSPESNGGVNNVVSTSVTVPSDTITYLPDTKPAENIKLFKNSTTTKSSFFDNDLTDSVASSIAESLDSFYNYKPSREVIKSDVSSAALSPVTNRHRSMLSPETELKVAAHIRERLVQPAATTLPALAPHSADLRKLVALGVNLKEVEQYAGAIDLITTRPFHQMQEVMTVLCEVGVVDVAAVINRYPLILGEEICTLKERILYLSRRQFSPAQILHMIIKSPKWFCEHIEEVDARLGAVQTLFQLSANDLRTAVAKCTRLIFNNPVLLKTSQFVYKEVFEFSHSQLTQVLVKCPSAILVNRRSLEARLDLLLNEMSISRNQISRWPSVLLCRERIIKERHSVLHMLQRDIYDEMTPGYVSLQNLVSGSNERFCELADITVEQYYDYLKTL